MKGLGFARAKINHARLWIHNATKITKNCTIGGTPMRVEVGNRRELGRIRA